MLPKVGAGDELVSLAVSTSRTSWEKTEMESRSSESRSKCWQWKGETRSGPDRRARAARAHFASAFVLPQINQWMTLIRQPVNWLQFLGCDVSTLVSISDKLLQAWHLPLMQPLRQQTKNTQWEIHLWERSCATSFFSVSFKMVALHYSRRNRGNASFRRPARCSRFSVNVTRELSLSCLMKWGFWWNCRIKRSIETAFGQLVIELRHEHMYAGEARTQIWISCIRAPSCTQIISIEEKNFNENVKSI